MIKKNKLFTVLLAVAFVFFATGCNKEEPTESSTSNSPYGQGIDSNIDELMEKTGIDIYALASSPELLRYFEAASPISEEMAKSIDMKPHKSLTEEERVARMNELVTLISQAAQNHNFTLVNAYFDEFTTLLNSMTNPWGETWAEAFESEAVRGLNEEAERFNDFLDSEYPSFFTLNSEEQTNVIEAIVDIFIQKKPLEDKCLRAYSADIRAAEVQYAISVAGCLFTGPGAWVCAGVALGIYSVQHHRANKALAACYKG